MSMTIEEALLARDRRGVAALASALPPDYCLQAARFVLERPGPVLIVTGFYILAADAPETDGPAGALVLGSALEALDYPVGYVTDQYTAPLLKAEVPQASVHTFPVAGEEESGAFAEELLAHVQPTLLVAIERCGRSRDGLYRNMRGADISPQTAMTDELFLRHTETIGIGDGGNEIGMGNLHDEVLAVPSLVRQPCIVQVRHLVIAGVANWGAYGLVAALSQLTGRDLLPSVQEHGALVRRLVALGAVDGITAARDGSVDGFSLAENLEVLAELQKLSRA